MADCEEMETEHNSETIEDEDSDSEKSQDSNNEEEERRIAELQKEDSIFCEEPNQNSIFCSDEVDLNTKDTESASADDNSLSCPLIDTADDHNYYKKNNSHPLSNGCLDKGFMEADVVVRVLTTYTYERSHNSIPDGIKNDVFFVVKNNDYVTGRGKRVRTCFSDDCGIWDSSRGSTPKTYFIANHEDGTLKIAHKKGEQFCYAKKVKRKKTFIPLEPQPSPESIIELVRSYSTLKNSSYKRRVSRLGIGAKNNIAVVEYSGKFPGLAPHGNSKMKTEYIRTRATVLSEMSDLLKRENPLNVYNKLTLKNDERHGPRNRKQLSKNPYLYDTHIELITILKRLGELEQLRDARQKMSDLFPLTEDLWLDWLRDEIPLASDEKERQKVEDLFEKAVKDYLSVSVWLEYVQFSIGGMAAQDGIIKIREVFEKALSSAGLHVTQGSSLWEAYREFENAILLGIMPAPGQVATKQQESDFEVQHKRILALFRRQLSVPLNDMEESFTEFKEWLQEEVDSQIKQLYQKSLEKYNKIKPFENDLLKKENKKEVYTEYIDFEISHGNAARVICLFERSIKDNCLEPEMWLKYTRYLDSTLKDDTLSIPVYERSVRNCPWCSQLWSDYLLTLERSGKSHSTIKDTVDRALSSGFAQGTEYLQVWTTYCDYLRRKIEWDTDHTEALTLFRANIEKAVEHLYSIPDSDPTGSLRQFWGNIEARFCKNVTKGRELWNDIMTEGHGNEASMWLNFYQFERCYGDNKHCRKVLQRALNSVSDWPESIVEAFINFEREEGNLEQYEQTLGKCNAQMERIKERRKIAAEKEEEQKSKHTKSGKKLHKTFEKGANLGREKTQFKNNVQKESQTDKQQKKTNNSGDNFPVKPYKKTERKNEEEKDTGKNSQDLKRKREDDQSTEKPFKVPPPPGFKGKRSEVREPPPGFKGKKQDSEETPAKIQKTEEMSHQGQGDLGDKSSCTAFVSNLAYNMDEDSIKEVFSKIGEIVEIRLIKNFKGKSKGYAYVEFKDELCVMEALKLDRTPVEGRPMYISKCEEKSSRKPQFKFATEMEKNKLFVKGLPFTCTKEALAKIFSQHGKLKDVRLVTYRSGAPKGLAYVEYEDEQTASQAVMKVDGLMIGDHAISVDISNPPERKMSKKDEEFIPSLGGGKKETEIRGKARTQVSLVPRSLKNPPGPAKRASAAAKSEEKSPSNEQSTSGKSNSDFRKMLLGIK